MPRSVSARQLGEQVLARNMFDSETGPLPWDAPEQRTAEPSPPAVASEEAGTARVCGGGLRLIASIVNAAQPERSLAAVRKDDRTHLLAPGRTLAELTLSAVHPAAAEFRSPDGTLCSLAVFASAEERALRPAEPVAPSKPEPTAEPKPPPNAKPFFAQDELERGVRAVGGGYALSRALVLRALTDPGKAAAGAQFRPVKREGHGEGMEIRAVRGGSLLQRMGVQDGDVVRSLNGADLVSPTGLLAALRSVREADTVTIEIVRNGAKQSFQYLLD